MPTRPCGCTMDTRPPALAAHGCGIAQIVRQHRRAAALDSGCAPWSIPSHHHRSPPLALGPPTPMPATARDAARQWRPGAAMWPAHRSASSPSVFHSSICGSSQPKGSAAGFSSPRPFRRTSCPPTNAPAVAASWSSRSGDADCECVEADARQWFVRPSAGQSRDSLPNESLMSRRTRGVHSSVRPPPPNSFSAGALRYGLPAAALIGGVFAQLPWPPTCAGGLSSLSRLPWRLSFSLFGPPSR
jgi:hypothetical protein